MEVNVNAESKEELQILTKANKEKPKKEDLQKLRKLFDERPELWQNIANLSDLACRNVIGSITKNTLFKESMTRATKELKKELGYDESTMSERLVIDQIVLNHLAFHQAQHVYNDVISRGTRIANAKFLEQRLSGAQRRYLRAIEVLARIRKLGITGPIQVNIGEQQVNVAG